MGIVFCRPAGAVRVSLIDRELRCACARLLSTALPGQAPSRYWASSSRAGAELQLGITLAGQVLNRSLASREGKIAPEARKK